jgi:hypothetical protein
LVHRCHRKIPTQKSGQTTPELFEFNAISFIPVELIFQPSINVGVERFRVAFLVDHARRRHLLDKP